MKRPTFASRLLAWWDRHGRHDLPWQQARSPYRVWIAEIMLQQTGTATVANYFTRFVNRFPRLEDLAAADLDEVLHLWSGLGYYARARNLHRAAGIICREHRGRFPKDFDAVHALPGIGRSTAGAILALAHNQRHPILDGNVKRVLCRYHAVDEWPGKAATARELWRLADRHTPDDRVADYTQAIMDLGATLCRRASPNCAHCPLASGCRAKRESRVTTVPVTRPRKALPNKEAVVLLVTSANGAVLLEKRPLNGVWGGLWSLPVCEAGSTPEDWCQQFLGERPPVIEELPPIIHTFTHFRLHMQPVRAGFATRPDPRMKDREWLWYNIGEAPRIGLAAPVAQLLRDIAQRREAA